MVKRQREMGVGGGVVMEGRDIGTVVFPDAEVKIFLDAEPLVREERRLAQHQAARGSEAGAKLVRDLKERDRRDSTRAVAPLVAAADAVHIDSSHRTLEQVIAEAERIVGLKIEASCGRQRSGSPAEILSAAKDLLGTRNETGEPKLPDGVYAGDA